MNFYKKIIKNQDTRFAILRFLEFIPDKPMVTLEYFIKTKRFLNLKNPERYTEKVQWYKLYYRDPLMMQCVDKYNVRKYIESKGLGENLVKLYQVVDDPSQIDFDALPGQFIIKTANGSGTNIICRDKNTFDTAEAVSKMGDLAMRNSAYAGREWAYSGSSKKIIVEELLIDDSTPDKSLNDYKFYCFGGKPEYIVVDKDRFTDHKRNFYDTEWNYIPVDSDYRCFGDIIPKPENFDEMLRIASVLSADFPAVRVDLYNVKGKIYFGELTFYPMSGYFSLNPDSFDFEMGKKFVLPEKKV